MTANPALVRTGRLRRPAVQLSHEALARSRLDQRRFISTGSSLEKSFQPVICKRTQSWFASA
jgi:hypothetical protein